MTSSVNQIPRCDWLPEPARWNDTARSGFLACYRKTNVFIIWCFMPCNKSFIDQVCSVKIAGYWSRSINTQKNNLANIQLS